MLAGRDCKGSAKRRAATPGTLNLGSRPRSRQYEREDSAVSRHNQTTNIVPDLIVHGSMPSGRFVGQPELQGFGDVARTDALLLAKVGNGPGHAKHACRRPGAQSQPCDAVTQQ